MDISGSLALVTGGAGFIGSRLAAALLARGCRVRVLDSEMAAGRIEIVRGDVRDPGTWARALPEVDFVFHMAAAVGADTDARRYLDVNAGGTAELYHALESVTSRVRKVVVASSLGVYGEGTTAARVTVSSIPSCARSPSSSEGNGSRPAPPAGAA